MISASRVLLFIVTILGATGLVWCVSESRRPIQYLVPLGLFTITIAFIVSFLASLYIHTEGIYYAAIATICMITLVVVMFSFSKDKWYKLLFEISTQTNAFLILMYVGKSFGMVFGDNEWADAGFRAIGFLLIYIIYKFYLKKKFRAFANQYDHVYGWILLTVLSLAFSILFLSIQYFPVTLGQRADVKLFNNVMICAIVVYTLTYFAFILLFNRIVSWEKTKHELKESEMKMDYWKAQIAAQQILINSTRKIKHDMRHHDALLADCIANKEYDKALEYLKEHGAIIDQMTIKQYCENYTVNCLLSTYIGKAEAAGIKVDCMAEVPKELKIDDLRLGSMFANLVENAIEACERIKDDSIQKFINISSKYENGALRILVENSSNNDVKFEDGFPISQKENPSGIGTKTIAEFAERFDGMCDYSLKNGVFSARLILVV